jgi:hypothetical protein
MADTSDLGSLERLLRPLRRDLKLELADALLRLKVDEEVQVRYEELAEKNTEASLTPCERTELASLVRGNSILSVLKSEARAVIQQPKTA